MGDGAAVLRRDRAEPAVQPKIALMAGAADSGEKFA